MTQIEDNRLESMINQTIHTSVPMAETTPCFYVCRKACTGMQQRVFNHKTTPLQNHSSFFFFLVLHIKNLSKTFVAES